jgi:hypothetical protein
MPRLRRKEPPAEPLQVEWVIAMESFRPQAVGVLIPKGEKRRISDPIVQQRPQCFAALVPLTEELLAAGKR